VKNVTIITHPLVQHNLTRLRDQETGAQEFRRVLSEVAALMVYEATRSFAVMPVSVTTPLAKARGCRLQREVVLVPVLRAGLGMLDSILQLIPHARVGFIGLKREETTLRATSYHKSLPPDLSPFEVILIDPMLATGGSAVAAMDLHGIECDLQGGVGDFGLLGGEGLLGIAHALSVSKCLLSSRPEFIPRLAPIVHSCQSQAALSPLHALPTICQQAGHFRDLILSNELAKGEPHRSKRLSGI